MNKSYTVNIFQSLLLSQAVMYSSDFMDCCFLQVKIHMKVHVREDATGLGSGAGLCGPASLGGLGGGGASGGPPLHSMPPIFPPYSDHKNRSASLHSSDSHVDLDPHLSNTNMDSDNDCHSEPADADYEMRHEHNSSSSSSDRASVRHLSNSSSSGGISVSSSNVPANLSNSSSNLPNSNNNNNNNNHSKNSTTNSLCHTSLSNSTSGSGSYVSGSLAGTNNKLAKISSPSPESPTMVPISSSPLTCLSNSQPHPSNQTGSAAADDRHAVLKDSPYHLGAANLKK